MFPRTVAETSSSSTTYRNTSTDQRYHYRASDEKATIDATITTELDDSEGNEDQIYLLRPIIEAAPPIITAKIRVIFLMILL